ncbi:MAG: DUF4251 domain-containing protein [Bacteroidales bacterium]|nr:DUF4251 domain-containing protein [Bacteroidales bacterium]
MKKIAYFVGMFLVMAVLFGQTADAQNAMILSKKEQKRIEKLRKEKERNMKRAASRTYYMELLKKKYFVFQADYVITPRGTSFVVSPDINFFSVVGNKVIIQFGLDGVIGPNGVGGITARGTIMNYKLVPGKKNNMYISTDVSLVGPGLPPHITMNVADDGTGQLTIQLNNGRIITLYGQVVSPKKASIFVGQSIF